MDMMNLRRMVMAQMASGADFVKGTFTVSNGGTYVLNFGKTFQKYLYMIDMTDESKTALLDTNLNAYRAHTILGMYPAQSVSEYTHTNAFFTYRINPSTKSVQTSNNNATAINESSISIGAYAIDGTSTNYLFVGYSYNYYIVEIKD